MPDTDDRAWWRDAVFYEVYPRSFVDSDGDGIGDVRGLRSRLGYLADLGVDAVWIAPWYPSPQADGGYDVVDHRDIDPALGSLDEADRLIADAAALGLRVIVDVVPNHVSERHPWFEQALASPPKSPARERFWFRPGRGPGGTLPPNDWRSEFGGPAWTRLPDDADSTGEWYLHLFSAAQPDLNWSHPQVRAEFEDILRFWLDRGAAGIRIDSAALLAKDTALPGYDQQHDGHPHQDRDEVHDIYRSWRAIADSYPSDTFPGRRLLVGEVWLPDTDRFLRYLRPDELHTAFNFDFMTRPWQATSYRAGIEQTLRAHASIDAPASWVLSNHDVTRPVTRFGRQDTSFSFVDKAFDIPTDRATGTRRARAAVLLAAALPGILYVYQGEELGLPEVEAIPADARRDPMFVRSGRRDPGRDGCRVPLPWSGSTSPFGFSPPDAAPPWLPMPQEWQELTVDRQSGDPASMLALYRQALRIRAHGPHRTGEVDFVDRGPDVLAFRTGALECVVNFSDRPVDLGTVTVLLASGTLPDHCLPPDHAVWLQAETSPPVRRPT